MEDFIIPYTTIGFPDRTPSCRQIVDLKPGRPFQKNLRDVTNYAKEIILVVRLKRTHVCT